MVELIPFGKYQGKSVEQVALEDPGYFIGHLLGIEIKKRSLDIRLKFVNHVANNFISKLNCTIDGCSNPAQAISIYYNLDMNVRQSDTGFIYCSRECFEKDPKADKGPKIGLLRLGLATCLSPTKTDTKRLVEVVAECMGLRSRIRTKEYLYDFFNECELRVPYSGPRN